MALTVVVIAITLAGAFLLLPLLIVDGANRRTNNDIKTRGHMTTAEILSYSTMEKLYVKYEFTPKGHQTPIVSIKSIGGRARNRVPVGSIVQVWYLGNAPTISVLEPYIDSQDAAS